MFEVHLIRTKQMRNKMWKSEQNLMSRMCIISHRTICTHRLRKVTTLRCYKTANITTVTILGRMSLSSPIKSFIHPFWTVLVQHSLVEMASTLLKLSVCSVVVISLTSSQLTHPGDSGVSSCESNEEVLNQLVSAISQLQTGVSQLTATVTQLQRDVADLTPSKTQNNASG